MTEDPVYMNGQQAKIGEVITSHSLDNVFDSCPRKFEFMTLFDKRPPREEGFAASVGDAVHDGVQGWAIARQEGHREAECIEKAMWLAAKRYPWHLEMSQYAPDTRAFGAVIDMIYKIVRLPYWDDHELVAVDGRGWAVEVPWRIKHKSFGLVHVKALNRDVMLMTQGKIDLILRQVNTGKIKTVDIKSTVTPEHLLEAEYKFSGQMVGYSSVVHAMLGVSVGDFDIDYLVGRFNSSERPEVKVLPIHKDAEEIEDYWRAKFTKLSLMKSYAEEGWFPRRNGSCHAWNSPCQCLSICARRDKETIHMWFAETGGEPIRKYDYWVDMEL